MMTHVILKLVASACVHCIEHYINFLMSPKKANIYLDSSEKIILFCARKKKIFYFAFKSFTTLCKLYE